MKWAKGLALLKTGKSGSRIWLSDEPLPSTGKHSGDSFPLPYPFAYGIGNGRLKVQAHEPFPNLPPLGRQWGNYTCGKWEGAYAGQLDGEGDD